MWDDAPKSIEKDDRLFLPVDAVIIAIFKKLGYKNNDFEGINNKLNKYYIGDEIEVWDDLWFWGFITQKGTGENREHVWNDSKYWSLEHSDKNAEIIEDIKKQAAKFLKILLS